MESRKCEPEGYISAKTEYDALGRVKRVSNPYRPLASEPLLWTESKYDSLGRVTEVKTPDDAKALTSYLGNTTTVTDQAGAMRRSVTDALGHLVRVDEPNSAGQLGDVSNPNQPTNYAYDALSNLLQVQQEGTTAEQCGTSAVPCFQTRSFVYDSLSRLLTAQNPESGTISYAYDPNGNLTEKTDARGVMTGYFYDALDRVTNRNYSTPNGTPGTGALANYAATPSVTYFYDGANVAGGIPNSKGRMTKTDNGLSKTEYTEFDILGRVKKGRQTTDGTAYNEMEYSYNLSGALVEEKYPSGRVVRNVLDNDGDLSMVQSKRNANNGYWNYAHHFTYTAAGAVGSMQLGNGTWEQTIFNSRLKPTQIALGRVQNATDLLKLDYTYGVIENNQLNTAKNNGNIQSQTITVPTVGSSNGFTAVQTYKYDSLNRIDEATEMVTPAGSSTAAQSWKQDYTFDRYGDRNFIEANTTTIPRNCLDNQSPPNPAICDEDRKIFNPSVNASNNRLSSADGYQFDAAGNTIRDPQNRKFTYDAENKQTKVETVDANGNVTGTIGEYFYDGDGRRVKKIAYTNNQVSETTVFVYDASSRLVAEYSTILNPTPQVAYLTNDHLRSPRVNTDENGKVVASHDYRPYGEEVTERTHSQYAADTIRKQFTGYERDGETDLDFAQARMYSNQLGRFSSSDTTRRIAKRFPQSWNRFTYVFNRPFTYTDGDGYWPTIIHDLIIKLALPNLSSGQINAIQVGSFSVDVPWTLFAPVAFQHAMRSAGQSEEDARNLMNAFVAMNNQRAATAGNGPLGPSEQSLFYFGQAIHPLTDNTSPTHRPFQIYDDSDLQECATLLNPFSCYAFWSSMDRHSEGESFIFNVDLQAAITAVRNNYRSAYGEKALKDAVGIFGNARYVFGQNAFGLLIDGQDNPDMVDLGNLGTVTVHVGPLSPVGVKPKRKKK
ncbi:MAG: RHS repeat protein [Acidobacteria bacterium]|nr:RHS repeat protein [Acidobacteriota bacterium]